LTWSVYTSRTVQVMKLVLSQLSWRNLPYRLLTFHVQFPLLRSFIQRIRPSPRPFVIFRNKLIFLRWGFVSPMPNPTISEADFTKNPKIYWEKKLTKCKSVWLSSIPQHDTSVYEVGNHFTLIATIIYRRLLCSWISRKPST
jgi:hypothetical protein